MASGDIEERALGRGLPSLKLGAGPPLVVAAGLSPDHRPVRGLGRMTGLIPLRPLARSRTVWWVNRRPGLDPHASMADIADDYADALRSTFDAPIDVMGVSTGGSVALQLAVDNPGLVRRLVIVASGSRLGDEGRRSQRRIAADLAARRPRSAGAELGAMLAASRPSRAALGVAGWLAGPAFWSVDDPGDVLATIGAEDRFDLTARLGELRLPVLVVGGTRDLFYESGRIGAETAAGIAGSRLIMYRGKGHLGVLSAAALPRDVLAFLSSSPPG